LCSSHPGALGLPDEGKGQILADMAARVTRGDEWPCNEGRAPQGNVILLSAEDDASDTVVPRLKAAGADLRKMRLLVISGKNNPVVTVWLRIPISLFDR
jgi:hypothetical protein